VPHALRGDPRRRVVLMQSQESRGRGAVLDTLLVESESEKILTRYINVIGES